MVLLITLSSLSGAGKSEVFDYMVGKNNNFFPMNTYTSRPARKENETGYEFHDKQFFIDHENEFVELATYPPHSNPLLDDVHYYGKHQSQFDGKNYIMAMDEVGVLSLRKLHDEKNLFGYELITIFVTCDDVLRLQRIGQDVKRDARDAKRKLLPLESYDYVLDNSGSKEELFKQVEQVLMELKK